MSSLNKANKNLKFDKRLTDWNLNNGHISREEWKKYLESLPDLAGRIDLINLSAEEKPRQDAH